MAPFRDKAVVTRLPPDVTTLSGNTVTNTEENYSAEPASTRTSMPDYRLDLPAVVRQIRLSRCTLGAILNELESRDRSPATSERLAECSANVAGEIEELWETIKQLR